MIVYLAGGISGNLHGFWKEYMNIYQAGTYSRPYVIEGGMRRFLAGVQGKTKGFVIEDPRALYILETYYYLRNAINSSWMMPLVEQFKGFMLDSGAFTFMSQDPSSVDFEEYTRQYAKFVNEHGVRLFFELDIDSVVPWQRYLDLRKLLEDLTGKDPIPVFHKSRGREWFQNAVRNHEYVAIGGIVTGEIKRSEFATLGWFIDEAHRNDCKIHGLGFTNLQWLRKLNWDSVDSTAWLYGNRSGVVYQFDGKTIQKHTGPENARLKSREVAIHNFNEWAKFAEYMEGR